MTLRSTYTTLIRPILEYASLIWDHASENSASNKLESIQARADKIITSALSFTNNLKVIKECGFETLNKRRKLTEIRFTIRQEVASLVILLREPLRTGIPKQD